jgi:hypothetical protein
VLGLHFGPSDFSVSAQLETCRCLTAAWTSSTTVQCANANGLQSTIAEVGSRALRLHVTLDAVVGTSSRVFSFDGPTLSAAFQNAPFTGRASVTVTGLNFGSVDYTASSFNHGSLCVTHAWGSSTSVICQGAVAVFALAQVVMTVGAVSGTGMSLFTCDGTPPLPIPLSPKPFATARGIGLNRFCAVVCCLQRRFCPMGPRTLLRPVER